MNANVIASESLWPAESVTVRVTVGLMSNAVRERWIGMRRLRRRVGGPAATGDGPVAEVDRPADDVTVRIAAAGAPEAEDQSACPSTTVVVAAPEHGPARRPGPDGPRDGRDAAQRLGGHCTASEHGPQDLEGRRGRAVRSRARERRPRRAGLDDGEVELVAGDAVDRVVAAVDPSRLATRPST